MNLPTWITFSRLAGIPIILVLLLQPTPTARWWSVAVFLVVAATDWLDGYLARRLNQVTDLGKFLDPLVDKLLVLCTLMALIQIGAVPAWGVSIILARELAIAGWRVSRPKISGANIWGKLKTVSQIGAIALLLAPLPPVGEAVAAVAFWVSVGLTVLSGILYVLPQKTAEAEASA
ncbi:MAG: CDP-diacylglycerol--glycerol-3-phosphate 3-phosphatidyltransferase [Cyanobacteria bacterium P01_A01_bin.135]